MMSGKKTCPHEPEVEVAAYSGPETATSAPGTNSPAPPVTASVRAFVACVRYRDVLWRIPGGKYSGWGAHEYARAYPPATGMVISYVSHSIFWSDSTPCEVVRRPSSSYL